MEDLKEMFAQMMKFQMESQQKKKKKRGKAITVLSWITKTTRRTF